YPERFDEQFALRTILADVERFGPRAGEFRYVSLHHLPADDPDKLDHARYRDALFGALTALTVPAAALKPIGPGGVIWRLELPSTPLNQRPFVRVRLKEDGSEDPAGTVGDDDFSLFDLILLEYPLGRLPGDSDLERQLTERFLKPAKQVRP